MDDCLLWGNERSSLLGLANECGDFLKRELELTLHAALPVFLSRCGIDVLGCRVFGDHLKLNQRSRRRYRARLRDLEKQFVVGDIVESDLQRRSESLTAFTTADGVRSWKFPQ